MLPRSFAALAAVLGAIPLIASAGGVYWSDRGASQLKRMNFDGSGLETVPLTGAVTTPGTNIRGIAADNLNQRIYWADNGADRLLRANLDGSGSTILHTIAGGNSFPADVRLDLAGGWFYWCDQTRNRIQRSPLDGGSVVDVITNAAPAGGGPYFMELDVPAGKVYWGDFSGGAIHRANLDGTRRETLLTGNNDTRGVRIDPRERMLYWVNRNDKKVHRCPLAAFSAGTIPLTHPAVQTLYTNLDTPHGLTLDVVARKIYWADTGTNPGLGTGGQSVCRGDFDGGTPLEILASGTEPWDVDLDLRCANYTEWLQRCFRRDAPSSATEPSADPDVDGIPNAVEYALDLTPTFPDRVEVKSRLTTVGAGGQSDSPALEYLRRAGTADLHYDVQLSTNLTGWTEGAVTEAAITAQGDGLESILARSVHALDVVAPQFLRVRVTLERQ